VGEFCGRHNFYLKNGAKMHAMPRVWGTKWVFESFFNVEVKVVLDRQDPLVGTGLLPDWLRNFAHNGSMVTLDTYQDNLCLWRCIAGHRGSRADRCERAA